MGNTSFTTGLNWSDATAPSSSNDYLTSNFRLRTPADGGSYTFGGASLTIDNTTGIDGGLTYKGAGATGIITINNLILSGGSINSLSSYADTFQLAGNLLIAETGGTIQAKQSPITISAVINGSGPLTVGPSDNIGGNALTFSAMNTFTGNITVATNGNFILDTAGGLVFDINASGVNNGISGSGVVTLNGTFTFDLTGASTTIGDSWSIVAVNSLIDTFNASFHVAGFTELDNVWTSADGVYQFTESTGMLAVVPEPSTVTMFVLGGLFLLARIQPRRKA